MKTSKRDVRKPELAIYRPGMGLQNKTKNGDHKVVKSESSENCILEKLNSLIESNVTDPVKVVESNSTFQQELAKTSKNVKNRRPDIKVYTPKPKIVAQLNDKKSEFKNESKPPMKEDWNPKYTRKKSPTLDVESKILPEKKAFKYGNQTMHSKNIISDSPLATESSWDIDDSDVSNSRSSPEKMQSSYVVNVDNYVLPKEKEDKGRRNKKKHRSNSKDVKTYVNQNHKSENASPTSVNSDKISNEELHCNRITPNDKQCLKDYSENKKGNVQITHESSFSQSRNSIVDGKTRSERKKRNESLPPRLQKNRNQHQKNNLNPSKQTIGSGGILKLPVQFDKSLTLSEPVENPLFVPKIYPEPQVYIYKTLFDPNNPNKPEVINVPAPHSPYCNVEYSPDPSAFLTHSGHSNTGYIPPPQPPMLYELSDVSSRHLPDSFLNKTDAIPAPVPTPVYYRPSSSYRDITPVLPETGKKKLKPIVESNLREISIMERELSALLNEGFNDDTEERIHHCRSRLQFCYADIILADPTYCAERNPEQSLWRAAFHQIIELYRKHLEENAPDSESIKEKLLDLIFHGTHYFKNLIEQLEQKFGFDLGKLLVSDTVINMSLVSERIRVVLISVQKIHVYLGDLARYKERVCQTSNYGKARSYYQKASQILPKNGRPYYQLALVSVSTRRKLDAVYFYIRSLAASNPILSAKESLLTLFEEVKRKYEIYEKKRIEETPTDIENLNKEIRKRVEVWIKPDGSSNQRPAEMDNSLDSSNMKNLSDAELNKRFVTSFLHVHGKLFTKVGMESFPDTLNQMLKEFYFLLQRTPLLLTSARLMQLLAINIFSVDNSSKESGQEHGVLSLRQEQALFASMAMMSILMERCHMLYISNKSSPDFSNHMIGDDLAELLPSIKIWTDWMSCDQSLWVPPSSSVSKELNVGFTKDVWSSFADFLTVLREVDIKYPNTSATKEKDCDTLILEEDNAFAGFVPLLTALQDPIYVVRPYDKVLAKHAIRINRIQFFGDYLCGITPPHMEFDVENKRFVSLMKQVYSEESYERSVLQIVSSCEDMMREDDISDGLRNRTFQENVESNELQMLWSKKEKLSKTKEQQEKYIAEIQAVLQKHESQRSTVLKIKPKYLIPDTNCFIDHLRLFRNILALSSYHLIVPLVVINELDGLARGTRVNEHTSPEHANRVTVLSREAIHFLEEQFVQKNSHIKAITSKGSILDTISFRSEEMGKNKGTNDDLILSCCLYYCKDKPDDFMPQNHDEPVTLFREVVLLTDDRNLRVKALAHHVPVRDLQSFLQWVNS